MDPDLTLTLGLLIGVLSIPSILSAVTDGRAPRASALTILIAGGLILFAVSSKPGGYQIDQIPEVVLGVVARIVS
ncbi:hypothetical protein ACFMPD_08570 [Sedimentitalea sp. HM32M-2]|uniref:hypothetical protein n=1 Tax=Sedimentitalea sp. HM32M-2 TaxID=3351566 RepID=UPI00362D6A84